jgi:formate dehydrogenase subunit gamma
MSSPTPTATPARTLRRFGRVERAVHRTIAGLMIVCMLTAAILYYGPLAIMVGHRRVVELVHVYAGFALPIPIIFGLISAAYRADLGRLNRWTRSDWKWLRSRKRRDGSVRVGKFNAGQKLNASLSVASILVLLGTGLLMYFPHLARLTWRTGATFVHDWFALAVGLLVLGHITYALRDSEARRGMRTGRVSAAWARDEHAAWAEQMESQSDEAPPSEGA